MAAREAYFRCYAELNDGLPPAWRYTTFAWPCEGDPTLGEALAAMGVPAGAVDLLLVDGRPVGLGHRLKPGQRVAVYPVFEALDISAVTRLRDTPLRDPRFVADVHLGRLARLLRMLGFDVLWRNDYSDGQIVAIAAGEGRIVLTRDRGLLADPAVTRGCRVASDRPAEQAVQVLARFDLVSRIAPFTRCLVCNAAVAPVAKEAVLDRLPLRTRRTHDAFHRCTGCGRVYWEGAHHRAMRVRVDRLVAEASRRVQAPQDAVRRGAGVDGPARK